MDCNPPSSSVRGILQARRLEWVAISSPMHESEKWKWSPQSCPTLSDPMDYSPPGPPSMGFSRQEYWSGVPLPSPCGHIDWDKTGQLTLSLWYRSLYINKIVLSCWAPNFKCISNILHLCSPLPTVTGFVMVFVCRWFPTFTLCLPLLLSFSICNFLVS